MDRTRGAFQMPFTLPVNEKNGHQFYFKFNDQSSSIGTTKRNSVA